MSAIQVNKLLHGKNFEVIREINKGCQGSTYTGFYKSEDEQTKRKAILKKYSLYDDNQGFRDELKVLAKIKGKKDEGKLHGFPDIYSYKFNKNFGEIVLSNSGQDFNSFIVEQLDPFMRHRRHDKESYEQFQLLILQMFTQILVAIENLHKIGYCHGDLKFDNVCCKDLQDQSFRNPSSAKKVLNPQLFTLIDFGISQKWSKYDYVQKKVFPLQQENIGYFKGNCLYGSINAVEQKSIGPKDDIESLFYMVAYLLNDKQLPWTQNLRQVDVQGDITKYVLLSRLKNKQAYNNDIMKVLPTNCREAFKYIMNLDFYSPVDYSKIMYLVEKDILSIKVTRHQGFCSQMKTDVTSKSNHVQNLYQLKDNPLQTYDLEKERREFLDRQAQIHLFKLSFDDELEFQESMKCELRRGEEEHEQFLFSVSQNDSDQVHGQAYRQEIDNVKKLQSQQKLQKKGTDQIKNALDSKNSQSDRSSSSEKFQHNSTLDSSDDNEDFSNDFDEGIGNFHFEKLNVHCQENHQNSKPMNLNFVASSINRQ